MSDKGKVPFLDLIGLHEELEKELVPVFQQTLRTAGFIGGPMLDGFERDFAGFCETSECIGVSSGTDAVRFALMAAGVQPGDVVVTVPHTFIATTEAITQAGARADFVDIDERTYCMDPAKLQEYLAQQCSIDRATGKLIHKKFDAPVTAVIPVHIYGQMADMDAILRLAREYKLIVVEDACQAHGAEYFSAAENRWCKAGSMGHAAAFSFYPGKNLGACGEGGAVTTNDAAMAKTVRMLRDHGQARKYFHELEGYNGRLDSLQAGILQKKLAHLAEWNEKRRAVAKRYNDVLSKAGTELILPFEPAYSRAVFHLYVVRSEDRDRLQEHLASAGIGTGIHYPIPVHLQRPYRLKGFKEGDFPVAEKIAAQVLSLPMFPALNPDLQERVISEIIRFQGAAEPSTSALPAVPA